MIGKIDQIQFEKMLMDIGISYNKELFFKLFWLFDANGEGAIEVNEFMLIIKWFKEFTVDQNIQCNSF
jgi:Ca2+-binding EF-hand superfamily protein